MRSWVLRSSNRLYLLPLDGSQRRPSKKKGQIGAEHSGAWLDSTVLQNAAVCEVVCMSSLSTQEPSGVRCYHPRLGAAEAN